MTSEREGNATPDRDENDDVSEPDTLPSKEESEKEAAERLAEIHQYLSDRYARRDVVMTTRTPGGQDLDWVPIESQLRNGQTLPDPPEEDRPIGLPEGESRSEVFRFELEREGAELGPPDTVPLVRKPIERIRPKVGLKDWLAKGRRANVLLPPDDPREVAPPEDAGEHKYVFTSQEVTCYGTEGWINIWDPYVADPSEFSLGQLALARGSGAGKQTLEVGLQEYCDLYGDWRPHLMLYYTTNGYTDNGDDIGGYNQDADGWIQSSNKIFPETLFVQSSSFDGTQYVVGFKVTLWKGFWFVSINGTWIGFYPASLYNTSGLRSQAGRVAWYGEVVDSDEPGATKTDMGSGHFPHKHFGHCAYMRNLRYQSSPDVTAPNNMSKYLGGAYVSHPKCYGIEDHIGDSGSWGSHFWWGGSGQNSQCP